MPSVPPASECMYCRVVLVSIQSWGEWVRGAISELNDSLGIISTSPELFFQA
jgi:hypothetical protein